MQAVNKPVTVWLFVVYTAAAANIAGTEFYGMISFLCRTLIVRMSTLSCVLISKNEALSVKPRLYSCCCTPYPASALCCTFTTIYCTLHSLHSCSCFVSYSESGVMNWYPGCVYWLFGHLRHFYAADFLIKLHLYAVLIRKVPKVSEDSILPSRIQVFFKLAECSLESTAFEMMKLSRLVNFLLHFL